MAQLFVEQLTVIDCSYLDAVRGVVGESWIVDIELDGELDSQSMVLDFGEVKKRLKRALDNSADHTLLVPLRHPGLSLHRSAERVALEFRGPQSGAIEHQSPAIAVSLLDADKITADAVGAYLRPILAAEVPPNVAAVHLQLRTEDIHGAFYHYTHGLKKHAGHCQRIAHGHRSRLEIRVNGQRDSSLESECAAHWRDIYLGTEQDLISDKNGRLRFEYGAAEGRFAIELPASRCDLMQRDSTVECIAEHLAVKCAAMRVGCEIEVRAYEGVMKGARARAHA